jgi:hypothetical protein
MVGAVRMPCLAQTAVAPPAVTLQDLTVPSDRLPAGCRLKVNDPPKQEPAPEPSRQEIGYTAAGRPTTLTVTRETPRVATDAGIATNPWIGTDRRILARLHQSVDGDGPTGLPMRLPDAPPLSAREQAALSLRFADGVDEGYAATYAQTGGSDLQVVAVRLESIPASPVPPPTDQPQRRIIEMGPIGTGASPMAQPADPAHRQVIAIGPIRVALLGGARPCGTAVSTYLTSLGK